MMNAIAAVCLAIIFGHGGVAGASDQPNKTILGNSKADVDALLRGWESRKSDFYSADTPTYDYQKDVTLTVAFTNDKAVGVVVTDRGSGISEQRFKELVALIGGGEPKPEDILRIGNGIHSFTVGRSGE